MVGGGWTIILTKCTWLDVLTLAFLFLGRVSCTTQQTCAVPSSRKSWSTGDWTATRSSPAAGWPTHRSESTLCTLFHQVWALLLDDLHTGQRVHFVYRCNQVEPWCWMTYRQVREYIVYTVQPGRALLVDDLHTGQRVYFVHTVGATRLSPAAGWHTHRSQSTACSLYNQVEPCCWMTYTQVREYIVYKLSNQVEPWCCMTYTQVREYIAFTVQPGRALVLNDLHTGQRVNCVHCTTRSSPSAEWPTHRSASKLCTTKQVQQRDSETRSVFLKTTIYVHCKCLMTSFLSSYLSFNLLLKNAMFSLI